MFRQPHVPETTGTLYTDVINLRNFLHIFCQDVWTQCKGTEEKLTTLTNEFVRLNAKLDDIIDRLDELEANYE